MSEKEHIFLEKGLLEQYAMGHCTPEEQIEVESMLEESSLIRKEYEEIQFYLEKMASARSKKVPASVRAEIFNSLMPKESAEPVKLDPIATAPSSGTKFWMMAASVIVLLGLAVSYFLWDENKTYRAELDKFNKTVENAQSQVADLQGDNALLAEQMAFVRGASTSKITLHTVFNEQDFALTAFWNESKKKVLLDVNGVLHAPAGKCYQLWADVEGVMLPVATLTGSEEDLVEATFYTQAESLNVTLEEAPGSDHATVANLIVAAEV